MILEFLVLKLGFQKRSRSQTSSFPRKIRGDTNFAHCRGRYKKCREPCTYSEIYRLARNQMDAATCTTSAFDNCRAFFMKQLNNYHHFAKSKVHDKPQFLDPVFRLTSNSLHAVWKLSKMSNLAKVNFEIYLKFNIEKVMWGWIS